MRMTMAAFSILTLAACGGGGGGSATTGTTGGGPSGPNPGPEPTQIQTLTGAGAPAETLAAQSARAPGILARTDSLIASSMYGDTARRDLPTFVAPASCPATTCTWTEPTTGGRQYVDLSDVDTSVRGELVGSKHGITLFRERDADSRSLGAWMDHGAFAVLAEHRFTYEGVPVNARYGTAGGDLSGSRPLGSATWQGLMVGTPATGTGRGDLLQGDATLTYSLDSQMLRAAFSNIQNIDRLRAHSVSTVRFTGVPVDVLGEFDAGSTGNKIQGGFYGSDHAEALGVFEQSNIVGAFGAKRQ